MEYSEWRTVDGHPILHGEIECFTFTAMVKDYIMISYVVNILKRSSHIEIGMIPAQSNAISYQMVQTEDGYIMESSDGNRAATLPPNKIRSQAVCEGALYLLERYGPGPILRGKNRK